jgi:hypothetical protein
MITPSLDKQKFDEAKAIVDCWDFSLAVEKLQEPAYAGWTLERSRQAELNYKRYLSLICGLGGYRPVPSADIDRFWHEHILDTERYARDCGELFNKMLHHYPYFGMRGDADNQNWKEAAAFSNEIWTSLFGEALYKSQSSQTNKLTAKQEGKAVTTINITFNVYGESAEIKSMSRPTVLAESSTDNMRTIEIEGKQFILTPAPIDALDDAMKCPQACPNEG